MHGIEYKNGLTQEQVQKAKELLRKVKVRDVCAKVNVKVSTVYNVLRDESPRIEDLKKVLQQAQKELKKKEAVLSSLL